MVEWLWFALLLHSLYVFFYEVSVQIICPVFCWVVCLYIIELYKSSLYILNTNPLLNKRFTNIFSQFVTWVSIFLKMTFNKQKVLISMKSDYYFVFCTFCILAKKSLSIEFYILHILDFCSLQSGCVSRQDHLHFRTTRHGPCKWTACARRGGRRG